MSVGKHFIIGIYNDDPAPDFFNFLKEYKIGGVMFLAKNFKNLEQLLSLINKIKQVDDKIIISVDHEGGRVQRFKTPFTVLPSFREYCKNKNETEIYNGYLKVAEELYTVGINLNFVPVADLVDLTIEGGAIGDRSIGKNIDEVNKAVVSIIKAYKDKKILTCVKHFPGHGVVLEDTHELLPKSFKTKKELFSYELIPFIEAIKVGVDTMMLSHIIFDKIDIEPVSTSKVFNEIIRKELNFNGLIITDDLSMGAITKYYGAKEASRKTLEAGTDLLILSGYSNYDLNTFAEIISGCEGLESKASNERIDKVRAGFNTKLIDVLEVKKFFKL